VVWSEPGAVEGGPRVSYSTTFPGLDSKAAAAAC